VFCKTIRPFNAEQIAAIVDEEKYQLAKIVYKEREKKLEEHEIRKIQRKMFPVKRRVSGQREPK
jgi:hypothetical protein